MAANSFQWIKLFFDSFRWHILGSVKLNLSTATEKKEEISWTFCLNNACQWHGYGDERIRNRAQNAGNE